jgi:mycothiol system anti-sigma-R factor
MTNQSPPTDHGDGAHPHDHAQCEQALRDVETFLDGELTTEQYRAVLSHLDDCMECFHAFDFQLELKQIIARKCSGDAMPPDLLARILQALDGAAGETSVG